jgi:hypothetical protein
VNTLMLTILGVITIGFLFVVVPVVMITFYRFRKGQIVNCPETHTPAEVQLDARRAAFTSAFHKPLLAVKQCSLWPKKKGCEEACVKENWLEP